MIELNLLEKRQPLRLPVVLGVDLNELNFKLLGVAFFIFYIPEIFVHSHFEELLTTEQAVVDSLSSEKDKITQEINSNANVKSQLEAYNNQVEKLKERSAQVDEILKIRTNPKKVLEKIARSIPEDLWFDVLSINENKDVVIKGGANSSRSIGEFITVINDSPFFANSLTPVKQERADDKSEGVGSSFEYFELKGKIKNYDMRSN